VRRKVCRSAATLRRPRTVVNESHGTSHRYRAARTRRVRPPRLRSRATERADTPRAKRQENALRLLLLTAYYSVRSYGIVALASWPFGLSRSDLRRWYRQESLGRLAALIPHPARTRR